MDLNDIRSLVTLASFVAFVGVVAWACGTRRSAAFDRAARSVLEEPDDRAERGRETGAKE